MKTPEQFYNEIMTNDELYESFLASIREGKADEFLKENEVTKGILSATGRKINVGNYAMTLLQTDTAINPGNSGGGLFDYLANKVKENFPKVYYAIDEVVYRAKKAYRDAVYDATH